MARLRLTMSSGGPQLEPHATIVNLIASTTTEAGLKVHCELDDHDFQKGIQVTDEQMGQLKIKRHDFHGDWNYTLLPKRPRAKRKS